MILSWAFIGIVVGLLLGLTGAGGAVIAIPLFVHLTKASLHEATVLSLIAVASGAVLNWFVQRKRTEYKISFLLFAFSIPGSYAFRPLKVLAPESVILLLFAGVGVLSLLSIWKAKSEAANVVESSEPSKLLLKSSLGGFTLGALVTMTGLGGGVVLVPLLTGVFRQSLAQAAATSLFAIMLTSVFSLSLQWNSVSGSIQVIHLLVLAIGSILSAFLTRKLIAAVPQARLDVARKLTITTVILLSVVSLFIRFF